MTDADVVHAEAVIAHALETPTPDTATPAAVAEQYIADTMAAQPAGSTLSWAAGVYRVRRSPSAVGEGKTLARAIRMIGAQNAHDENGARILLDESGEQILPE